MCMTELGLDLVSIPEIQAMLEGSGTAYRDLCWSAEEQTYCGTSAARYATRWAAKEATMKALGRGIGDVDPLDIEVVASEGQRPILRLSGSARTFQDEAGVSLALTMSHEAGVATALVAATSCCRATHDGRATSQSN